MSLVNSEEDVTVDSDTTNKNGIAVEPEWTFKNPELASKHLEATRNSLKEWLPRWEAANAADTINPDMTFTEKIKKIVCGPSPSRAHLESRNDNLRDELKQSLHKLRVDTLPKYLRSVYGHRDMRVGCLCRNSDNYETELRSFWKRAGYSRKDRIKEKSLFDRQQMKAAFELCPSVYGHDDEYIKTAKKEWENVRVLITRHNELNCQGPQSENYICSPDLYPEEAETILLTGLLYSVLATNSTIDRHRGPVQNMRSHINDCERYLEYCENHHINGRAVSDRQAELSERKHRLGEMLSIVENAYSVDYHHGGKRYSVDRVHRWEIPLHDEEPIYWVDANQAFHESDSSSEGGDESDNGDSDDNQSVSEVLEKQPELVEQEERELTEQERREVIEEKRRELIDSWKLSPQSVVRYDEKYEGFIVTLSPEDKKAITRYDNQVEESLKDMLKPSEVDQQQDPFEMELDAIFPRNESSDPMIEGLVNHVADSDSQPVGPLFASGQAIYEWTSHVLSSAVVESGVDTRPEETESDKRELIHPPVFHM